VLPVATEFLKTYPEIDIRFVFGDRVINLLEDQIDIAVRIGELPESSLIATRVGMIRRVVCGSPAYLRRNGKPKSPADLGSHACITFDGIAASSGWSFFVDKELQPVPVRSRLIVNNAEAAIDAAIAGLGLTRVLSYQVADALDDRKLVRVLEPFEPAESPVSLVYASQGRVPLKLRAFIDYAVPRLRSRLGYAG
jgi:DNA-binding transcriptional LysR family regulator